VCAATSFLFFAGGLVSFPFRWRFGGGPVAVTGGGGCPLLGKAGNVWPFASGKRPELLPLSPKGAREAAALPPPFLFLFCPGCLDGLDWTVPAVGEVGSVKV